MVRVDNDEMAEMVEMLIHLGGMEVLEVLLEREQLV